MKWGFTREGNIINYRISKKIYKRADFKLKSFLAANHDKRTTYDIAKEENILSGLERNIFISKQDKWTKRINDIVDELKAEEQIMDKEIQRWMWGIDIYGRSTNTKRIIK